MLIHDGDIELDKEFERKFFINIGIDIVNNPIDSRDILVSFGFTFHSVLLKLDH